MAHVRRVNARDVAQAGGLTGLIAKLLGEVRTGNMDVKERAAMFLRSLTEQAKGLGGPEENEDPVVMIAKAGGIKALVSLTVIGSPIACGRDEELITRSVSGEFLKRTAALCWRKGRFVTSAMRAFQETAIEVSKELKNK